jgi:heme exporter protein A
MRLTAEGLCVRRGGADVVKGVGFAVGAGQSLVVTGANGAGKSTLLRAIAGLLPLSAGRLDFEGEGEFTTLGSAVHYLGHQNALKPALSVTENLAFWRDFLGGNGRSVAEALDLVDLGGLETMPFAYLSTGQRRRASIARMLLSHRPLWLLDEPTAGLDRRSEQRFAALMADHLRAGGLIVAATHLPIGIEATSTLDLARAPDAAPTAWLG